MTTQRKALIGVLLSLSVFMIIAALVRITFYSFGNLVDSSWVAFWQNAEAAIAIIMMSLTAVGSVLKQEPPNSPVNLLRLAKVPQALAKLRPKIQIQGIADEEANAGDLAEPPVARTAASSQELAFSPRVPRLESIIRRCVEWERGVVLGYGPRSKASNQYVVSHEWPLLQD